MKKLLVLATLAASTLPTATVAPAQQSNWSHRDRTNSGYTIRQSAMRAGPDRDYPRVRLIPASRSVDVFGCLNDWSWCDVGYRGDRGWVQGRWLSADYQGRRRAFPQAAPYLGIVVLSFVIGDYWNSNYRGRTFYSQRPQWERRYNDHYRPQWGPRPSSTPQPGHQAPSRGDHQWNGQQQPGSGHNTPESEYRNRAVPARPSVVKPNVPAFSTSHFIMTAFTFLLLGAYQNRRWRTKFNTVSDLAGERSLSFWVGMVARGRT